MLLKILYIIAKNKYNFYQLWFIFILKDMVTCIQHDKDIFNNFETGTNLVDISVQTKLTKEELEKMLHVLGWDKGILR